MSDIMTFEDALKDANDKGYTKKHLLLGNGFSIAYRSDIFTYGSLLDNADFSTLPEARELFDRLETQDFEEIIKLLKDSAVVFETYEIPNGLSEKLRSDSEAIKEILVTTLAKHHPEGPFEISEEQYLSARKFLSHFIGEHTDGNVYTLNYDLLLYWVLMHEKPQEGTAVSSSEYPNLKTNDGFGKEKGNEEAEYVIWHGETSAHGQNVHYLHGALHLYDAGKELKKFTWINTGRRLIDQAREAMSKNMFPLFVSEGDSESKLIKIKHSGYLYHSYKSFSQSLVSQKSCLFIYGHSLANNDMHILNKIAYGKIPKVYISLYGGKESNVAIIEAAESLKEIRSQARPDNNLIVEYYDAKTANVWG